VDNLRDISRGIFQSSNQSISLFDIGQGKVPEIVVCLHCAATVATVIKINIARVHYSGHVGLQDGLPIVPQHSLRSTRTVGLACLYTSAVLININGSVGNTWKSRGI